MTFEQWQKFSRNIDERATALDRSVQNRGWALAASVGIPHDACCLHNASIDDGMTGWCKGNPHMLKVAKRANFLTRQYRWTTVARRIISRAWNTIPGAVQSDVR